MDFVTLALAKAYSDSKGGYIEPKKFVLESSVVNHGDEDDFGLIPFVELTPGSKYIVTVSDGKGNVSFECEAKESRDEETGTGLVYLGNIKALGIEDTGESFGVVSLETGDEKATALFWYRQTDVTIRVEQSETIHPIDPKYLPGAVLPVVELSTTLVSGVNLTEAEDALLMAAWEGGTPICVKCNLGLGTSTYDDCRVVFSRGVAVGSPSVYAFFSSFGSNVLQLFALGDRSNWAFSIQSM